MHGIISGSQVRMARAFLRWSIEELSTKASVGVSTVRRIEDADGLPKARMESIKAIHDAFTDTGRVEFQGDNCVCVLEPPPSATRKKSPKK